MMLVVQLCLRDLSKTTCEGVTEILPLFFPPLTFQNLPVLVELGTAPPPRLEISYSLHMYLTWNATQCNSTRSGFCRSLIKRERR